MLKYVHLERIDSTNAYLQRMQSDHDIRNWVVSADEQTAGKGMGSNGWESEVGKNLTFSLALDVSFLPAARQFLLSEAVALGLVEALDRVISDSFGGMSFQAAAVRLESMPSKPADKFQIKWPNDICFGNRKLAGILINSTIKADKMDVSIIGIGLNVNQMQFQDWPTHPVSLKMITGRAYDLGPLLEMCAKNIVAQVERLKKDSPAIEQDYLNRLFRYRTWANFVVGGKEMKLFMTGIDPFGRLLLVDEQSQSHCFDIKGIRFLI